WYGEFEQRENGVGAVRDLQTRIAAARDRLPDLVGKRIGVVTGTAMGPLMPQVLADVAAVTGGRFELVVVENALFGRSVTTAGLLPAAAIEGALRERRDLDLALVPAEAVNDDLVFIGRPNVGKSTLFNRLVGRRDAIVDERPGVTRDRHFGAVEWNGQRFWLVDTGGLLPQAQDALNRAIRNQVELAVAESDVVLFLV